MELSPEYKLFFAIIVQAYRDLLAPSQYWRRDAQYFLSVDSATLNAYCDLYGADIEEVCARQHAPKKELWQYIHRIEKLINEGY